LSDLQEKYNPNIFSKKTLAQEKPQYQQRQQNNYGGNAAEEWIHNINFSNGGLNGEEIQCSIP
jgi:hypothetical protein